MKNLSNSILVALLLIGLLAPAFQIKVANASGPIYILADGSISPPGAPISTIDMVTYTLTGDVNDSIVVERSNIVIDGAGHTVEGSGADNGFKLVSISNVTIKNTHIENFIYGVYIESASSITVSENNITANSYDGIGLFSSSRTIITGNNVTSNGYDGIEIYESFDSNISGNRIETNSWFGIEVYYSSNNHIFTNRITNHEYGGGIELFLSSDNSMFHNNFINNTNHASVTSGDSNVWDNGYPFGGNYWDDYTGEDLNGDGIGETSYVIDENNIDHVVLIEPYVPDAAITNTKPSKTVVGQGYTVSIDVTIVNQGNYMENLNFTAYANATAIKSQALTLTRWTSTTITLTWNTTGFAKGIYVMSAYAWPVPGETDTADNTYTDGTIKIGVPGDLNGDNKCNLLDLMTVALGFGNSQGDPGYDPNHDMNEDGKINLLDLMTIALYFGTT